MDAEDNLKEVQEQLLKLKAKIAEEAASVLNVEEIAVAAFKNSPDALFVIDQDGRIRLVNNKAELLTLYHRSELLGSLIEILVPDDVRKNHEKWRNSFTKQMKTRPVGTVLPLRLRRRDASVIGVDISLTPMITNKGTFVIAAVRPRPTPDYVPYSSDPTVEDDDETK